MTIWEFEVFSWSVYKTNKGDLLIKLDFHSEEKFGSLVPALLSIVAQSWRGFTGALWEVDEWNQTSLSPPAKRQIQHLQPPKQQQERGNH